jgi:beta-lactamase class D
MVTGEILKKSDNIQVNFDPKNKKVTLAFKIPNSMIGLETGVIKDEKYDYLTKN